MLVASVVAALAPAAALAAPDHHHGSDPHRWQTSDHVVGPDRPTTPRDARPATSRVKRTSQYWVSAGVHVASYQQRIGARRIRYHVLRIGWNTPGVGFSLAQPPRIADVQRVRWMTMHTPHAVAGVNGDFFDIGETGAPLGLGMKGGRIEHAINTGWNRSFFIDRVGKPHIGTEPVSIRSAKHPDLGLTNLDSPQVRPGGIGVYDARWGRTSGWAWTQGQRTNELMAHVVGHRLRGFAKVYRKGTPITGQYLVARGPGAVKRLRRLKIGERVTMHATVRNTPHMALTGNSYLLLGGKVVATDNTELHPRTAIGIAPRHSQVFIIVVDGRQESSDGYTMVELARRLKTFGCTSALNLDGGGSSTMVAKRAGAVRVVNSPSDGGQRSVGNGLAVTYRKPHRHR